MNLTDPEIRRYAAIEAATDDTASPRKAFVVLNRCGKVLNLPTSLRLPPPNLNDEVLRTKPVLEVTEAEEAAVEAASQASAPDLPAWLP